MEDYLTLERVEIDITTILHTLHQRCYNIAYGFYPQLWEFQ